MQIKRDRNITQTTGEKTTQNRYFFLKATHKFNNMDPLNRWRDSASFHCFPNLKERGAIG